MLTKIITNVMAVIILWIVVELIRQEKLTFKYALAWMCVAVLAIVFSVFDKLLFKIAYLAGFELPSNFIFFVLLSIFVFISLLMTLFLCQQNRHNDTIAQKIGLLEFELKTLKKKLDKDEDNE